MSEKGPQGPQGFPYQVNKLDNGWTYVESLESGNRNYQKLIKFDESTSFIPTIKKYNAGYELSINLYPETLFRYFGTLADAMSHAETMTDFSGFESEKE